MRVLCAAAALMIAWPASAQTTGTITTPVSGHTYFNRPGATLEEQRADLEACRRAVSALTQWQYSVPVPIAPIGITLGALGVNEGSQDVADSRGAQSNYENCMVVRGWRVVQLDEAEGRRLRRIRTTEFAEWLSVAAGAEAPEGRVVRAFSNEMVRHDAAVVGAAGRFDEPSLSLRILPREHASPPPPPQPRVTSRRRERSRASNSPPAPSVHLPVGGVAALPEDSTLIVVSLSAPAYLSVTLEFERIDSALNTVTDRFAVPRLLTSPNSAERNDTIVAFAVPPGRWRIARLVSGRFGTTFCMGAPSFEVGPSEVVYAGAFGFGGLDRGPSMALEPAQTALAAAPGLAAKLRPAAYVNGDTFECGAANHLYAYEVEGAPFLDGYVFGSRAGTAAGAAP